MKQVEMFPLSWQEKRWRQARHELRARPGLSLGLVFIAIIAGVVVITALLATLLAGAAVIAAALLAYHAGRRLLDQVSGQRGTRLRVRRLDGESRERILQRYLYAIDDLSRLVALALGESLEAPRRGRKWRSLRDDARRLQRLAISLHDEWSGSRTIGGRLAELESTSVALCCFLDELERRGPTRLSLAELRWQRQDLASQRDRLVERLRATDLRGTPTSIATVS